MGGEDALTTFDEALSRLRTDHGALLADVEAGERALWVGSGVSRSQVPTVQVLLQTILTNLREIAIGENPNGAHRAALNEIAREILGLTTEQLADVREDASHFNVPSGPDLDALTSKYAEILTTKVGVEQSDYLLWTAGQVCERFGSDEILPGTDHYLIAMLAHERLLPGVVTTNWDGLIERATRELTRSGSPQPLVARVVNRDFQVTPAAPSLIKIHGCAVRARTDPNRYRRLLVATPPGLATVLHATDRAELVAGAEVFAKHYRTLFLGLSVQDADLLAMLASARAGMDWPWDASHPAFVFAEPTLLKNHRDALETVYGEPEPTVREEVVKLSPTGMYSTPVLATLVLHVLSTRLNSALETEVISHEYPNDLGLGIAALERHVTAHVGAKFGRLIVLLRGGHSAAMARFNACTADRLDGAWTPFPSGSGSLIGGLATFYALLGFLLDGHDVTVRTEILLAPLGGTFVIASKRGGHRNGVRIAVVPDSRAADLLLSDPDWSTTGGRRMMLLTRGPSLTRRKRDSGTLLGSARNTTRAPVDVTVEEIMSGAVDAASATARLKEYLAI